MKAHPTAQTLQWLAAKGDPLSRLDTVIAGEGFQLLRTDHTIEVAATERRLKNEDYSEKRRKTKQPRTINRQIHTNKSSRHENRHTKN